MKRNLIALGCAALLAVGLSFGTFAGSVPDADGDGVPDAFDNCVDVPNGPLGTPAFPPGSLCGQEDAGGPAGPDGYGNACDYDVTNDNLVTLGDLGEVLGGIGGSNLQHDFDCNNLITLGDLSAILASVGPPPGPSGLACAGTVPCAAP